MEKPKKGKLTGRPVTYEETFKIDVAREYLEGKLSQTQLGRKHGLNSGEVVGYFVTWYKRNIAASRQTGAAEANQQESNNADSQTREEQRLTTTKIKKESRRK